MANKITLTRINKYIETTTTVNITGSNLKNKYVEVSFANNRYGDEEWSYLVTSKTINNNTSYSFTYTASQTILNDLYETYNDISQLRVNVVIFKERNGEEITNYSFVSYIQPENPTFNVTPTYRVTDNNSLSLTNNNQIIVNGMSNVRISNITGVANKYADIKYISINDKKYNYNNYSTINYIDLTSFVSNNKVLNISLIDSRGFESSIVNLANFQQFKDYHIPIIKDMIVQRDGISTTTKLTVSGVYTEGYQLGIETLTPGYKYQEITSDDSGTIMLGNTQLTLMKTPTQEWLDYQAILEEYNNLHTGEIPGYGYGYRGNVWNNQISSLFEIALNYNNKYTKEYLEEDKNGDLYQCISGGYGNAIGLAPDGSVSWKYFWEDTLKEIQKVMYGSYIYGRQDKDYGIGGNYEFEIETTTIEGDLLEGFTLDKTFNIWTYINAGTNKESVSMKILPTAIPAIDVFKDKVALHGLYDETISDSDIQMWGNIFLNGYQLNNKFMLQAIKTSDTTDYSTNYNYFSPFNGNGDASVDIINTDKLTFEKKNVTYGDRTNNSVYGITIGSDIHMIKANYSVRFFNNYTSNVPVNVNIYRVRNNTAEIIYGTSSTMLSNGRETLIGDYYFEVEEGDFIFIGGYRATKTANVDVITTNNATKMIIETIS